MGEPAPTGLNPRAGMLSVGPNTNVPSHAGKTLALVEGGGANYRLTDDLDTVGPCDFDGTLAGGYTAHPHRDPTPKTGNIRASSWATGVTAAETKDSLLLLDAQTLETVATVHLPQRVPMGFHGNWAASA